MKKTLAAMLLASAALTGAAQAQGSGNVNLAYVEWSDWMRFVANGLVRALDA